MSGRWLVGLPNGGSFGYIVGHRYNYKAHYSLYF